MLGTAPSPEALAAADAACFPDAWDAAHYRALCGNRSVETWLLQQPDGAAVALLCLQRVGDEVEVYRIGVVPGQRRRGWAQWLLQCLQAQGCRRVWLEVRAGNAAARRLYRQVGFVETGRRRAYYRDPVEDAVRYRWAPAATT